VTVAISHETWGAWPALRLSSEEVAMLVVSEVGARVVSLRDLRRDREWLLGGDAPSEAEAAHWSSESVVFSGRESFGWDECLPTVSVCADPLDPDGPPLRDHGDQWGRGAYLTVHPDTGAIEHTWAVPRWPYRLTRRLSLRGTRTVVAEYRLASVASRPLPFLWSQHAVFDLEPGCRIDLPGVSSVLRTSQHGIDLAAQVAWPMTSPSGGTSIDLSVVHAALGWAAKLYAQAPEPVMVEGLDGARLTIDWDRDFAPALGIWLSYAGWPADGEPREQVALEPTTAPHDDLMAALASGRAHTLGPGEECSWWVTMMLS
jgi:galactose mutarotase-like enzyme